MRRTIKYPFSSYFFSFDGDELNILNKQRTWLLYSFNRDRNKHFNVNDIFCESAKIFSSGENELKISSE